MVEDRRRTTAVEFRRLERHKGDFAMFASRWFSALDQRLLRMVYEASGRPQVRLALQNGLEIGPAADKPVASAKISDRPTLARLLLNPDIGFGEAYTEGHIEMDGSLAAFLEAVLRSRPRASSENCYSGLVSRWLEKIQANTLRGSRSNIRRHYDLSNDFYKLWLDSQLIYTCAYFPTPSATLEEAQIAKMDHVCRKLQLQPGETIVEAGSGWGALALHMARNYGVRVRAFNISREQILYAWQRAREEGLASRVEFVEDDYRNISGQFDVFVSVGMLEHVGKERYNALGEILHRAVGESGRGLLHFIGRNWPTPLNAWIRKRVFPGAYPPTLRQVMDVFEPWDYSVLDVENLRLHYAKTLEHWLDRFERAAQRITEMFGPRFVKMWRFYLAGSCASFRAGTLQLFQVVFAGRRCERMPWTRAHLYASEPSAKEEPQWIHAMS
jgi:cyclopropane-fatty-acyl-phospholipid synthase